MVAKPHSNYFEPWEAKPAQGYEDNLEIKGSMLPEEVHEALKANREAALLRKPWVIWGSRMVEPCVAKTMTGDDVSMDDKGIIVKLYPNAAGDCLSHSELAKRICVCVNACQDLLDPGKMAARWVAIESENNELRDEVSWLRTQLQQLQEAWDEW